MGCPQNVRIDDAFTFTVTTHVAATGALTDADAVPAYRIYEDETGTAILTGNMAKLDGQLDNLSGREQVLLRSAAPVSGTDDPVQNQHGGSIRKKIDQLGCEVRVRSI